MNKRSRPALRSLCSSSSLLFCSCVFSSSCCRWDYSKKLNKTFCIKYRSVKSIYLHIFFSEKLCFVQPNFFSWVEFTPSAAPQCPFLKKTFLFNFLASFILVLRFKALLIIVYYFPYMFYGFIAVVKLFWTLTILTVGKYFIMITCYVLLHLHKFSPAWF